MAQPVDYDALRSDWSVFFELLGNDRGIRLRLNIPDTLVLRRGQPLVWFATNKDGLVVQRPAGKATMEDIRVHLLSCALDDSGRYSSYVAVMRGPDGLPKLLTRQALDALCERMQAAADAGEAAEGAPCILQAYVAPFLDLRFVTSYTNNGVNISCHTFQRRFSRRYLQYRDPAAPPPQPGVLTGYPAPEPSMSAAGTAVAAPSAAAAVCASGNAAGSGVVATEADADLHSDASLLDDAALADSERIMGRTLGSVDPSLKMAARKAAHGLVQYVQKAHLLTLRGLVCEFVRDSQGHLWLMGPLRADWASLIPGRGGEPWANTNLTQHPQDEESLTINDEVEQRVGADADAVAQLSGSGIARQQAGSYSLAGPAAEGSSKGRVLAAAAGGPVTASHLPPSALTTKQQQLNDTADQQAELISVYSTPVPAGGSRELDIQCGSPEAAALRSPQQQLVPLPSQSTPKAATLRRSPGPAQGSGGLKDRLLGSSTWQHQQAHATSPTAASGGARGCVSSALTSHLTKEVESMRDELLVKTDLADALAYKVEALEHDKHVITGAFEQVLGGMQGDLQEVKGRLEVLRQERDRLACQLAEVAQRLEGAEAEREQLRSSLDAERGTAFTSIGQFQKQQEDAGVRAARAETELRSVQERLKEEQAACDALKRVMVFYQHTGVDGGGALADGSRGPAMKGLERPEVKYMETLQDVDELLMREADPAGERYSLSKVLHTCQGDLHAIFLHYCLLDTGFARHWPPQLTLSSWLAFMKDIGSTNLVPGTRTRSDNTMHVQEATELFRRYCLRQAVMRGGAPLYVRPPSMMRSESIFTTPTSASAAAAAIGEQPLALAIRPPSSQSTASAAPTSRPFSATAAQLSTATMSYQSFCAALVHVAAKLARGSPEVLEACPFLSEQTRIFIDSIVSKAQRVAPVAVSNKKGLAGAGAGGAAGGKVQPVGGLGAKEAAAKEAAAKLPKLKKAKAKAASGAGSGAAQEMSAIAEASREGSAGPRASG